MRRVTSYLIFLVSAGSFFLSSSFLYAGDLGTAKSGANSIGVNARKVIDAALQPGTCPFIEGVVKFFGQGLDWSFDRLVVGADRAKVSEISDHVVSGMAQGLSDFKIDQGINQTLDAFEGLAKKFLANDFSSQILQGTPAKVKPYLKAGFEYNSNVFDEPEAPKTRDEVLWTWTPGVSVNFPFGADDRYRIGAVYEARFLEFGKYDQHDDIGQSFGALGNFKLTDNLYVNVTEEYVKDAARAGTAFVKRVEYEDQKVSPTVGYNWRDWTFETQYENAHRRYDSSIYDQFEYDNNVITGRAYRTLAPNFRGLLEYNYSHFDYDYDVTRPGRYHQGRVGVVGQLSERTGILARVGYMDRNYHSSKGEFDKPVADIRLRHTLTKRTDLDFYFHRTSYESTFTNNRFLDEKRFQASATYLFTSKLRGRTGGALIRQNYDAAAATGRVFIKRRDTVGNLFVGFDYAFRPWLLTSVDYRYERNNSNNSNFDYTNHGMALGLIMPL